MIKYITLIIFLSYSYYGFSQSLYYFPKETARNSIDFGINNHLNEYFSKHLKALEESSIYENNDVDSVFRFTWLRSFHHPVVIKVQSIHGMYSIQWKVSDGSGGSEPGKLIINSEKTFSKDEWNEMLKLFKQLDFWNIPSNKSTFGDDGAEWILEGKLNNFYQVVVRWSPEKDDFYNVCNYLLNMTNLKIKKKEKY